MKSILFRSLLPALSLALVPIPALADGPVKATSAQLQAKFQQDRALILGMAGNYKVRFDFRETTPWAAGYKPIEPKVSGGYEVVRVIEDTGRMIRLQHLLVVEYEGKTQVIKHWRQDWAYEPAKTLVYAGQGQWKLEDVPERMRAGRWSQTVWQTDDSPRYAGWGEWTEEGGVPRWRSNWTWRPLARRDAVRKPVYDRYLSINRHSPSPTGWIHWQDNIKMGLRDGKLVPFVQESVLNTYEKFDGYPVKAADDYWAATKDYWAEVRSLWDAVAAKQGGISVKEVADTGSAGAERLMQTATDLAEGKLDRDAAIRQARSVIAEVTRADVAQN
jgi:hypothetical protein